MRAQFRLLLLTLLAYLGSYWNDMQRSWSLSDDGRCLRPAWLLLRKPLPPLTRPEELGRQQLEHLRMRGEDVSWVHGGSSIPPYRAALRHFRLRCRVCSPAGLLRLRLFAAQLPTWRQWWWLDTVGSTAGGLLWVVVWWSNKICAESIGTGISSYIGFHDCGTGRQNSWFTKHLGILICSIHRQLTFIQSQRFAFLSDKVDIGVSRHSRQRHCDFPVPSHRRHIDSLL